MNAGFDIRLKSVNDRYAVLRTGMILMKRNRRKTGPRVQRTKR
jgi:hypothetical protein